MLRGVYALTDAVLMPDDVTLLNKVKSALYGGVSIVQYRDKSANAEKKLRQAQLLLTLCKNFNVPLIINDDVNLAKTINADGVHLGQDDISLIEARQQLGNNKIIGVTCHDSLALAQTAQQQGANYVALGACFASPTKPHAKILNHAVLREVKASLSIPIVAIGGINSENASSIINTGIDMIAVVSSLFMHDDVTQTAQQLVSLFKE